MIWLLVVVIVTVVTFFGGVVKSSKRIWNIIDTPTVTPSGAIVGLCEINGKSSPLVLPDGKSWPLLKSPITETECVWFAINLEELRKSGKSSSWHTIGSYSSKYYSIKDNYGHVVIDTQNSLRSEDITLFQNENDHNVEKAKSYLSVSGKKKNFITSFLDDMGLHRDMRISEYVIRNDLDLFAHGNISIWENGFDLVMKSAERSEEGPYVSTKGEVGILKKLKNSRLLSTILTTAGLFAFTAILFNMLDIDNFYIYAAGITFVVSLMYYFLLRFVRVYNRYIHLRQQTRLGRSTIDVTVKRRNELIPQITDVIDEVTKHVEGVQTLVTQMRSMALENYSPEIKALAESYPELNTSENFLQLQKELARSEEKVAMARSFVNDSILAMDNLRATLFGMIFSPLFAKEQRPTL